MVKCPSKDQLSRYLSGECSSGESARIERHLADCTPCCEWCMQSDVDDELVLDVRRVLDSERGGGGSSNVAGQIGDLPSESGVEVIGSAIEGFRISKELGRGGMGAVYLAEQQSTKRPVALKVLLEGPFASEVSKKRFEREVELAAHLDHRHIVTILESGISSGRYYFAMKYVEGRELDKYVKQESLSPRAILSLFSLICRAVNYAHQRGIIHRDLKPSNILVDGSGEPHVLDFGLAKVTDPEMDRQRSDRLLTVPGQAIGTLPYMSPEQTTGMQHDLDVRTDVYSLGLILFRLLTRRHPYKVYGEVFDVLRNITEVDAARPSSIRVGIDDEIDTIALKALTKDRDRRYQSADALADDIDRYLNGRPILAKQDSAWYVVRKIFWRNRVPLMVAVVVLALLGATVFALIRQRSVRNQSSATSVLTSLIDNPSHAVSAIATAEPAVHRLVSSTLRRLVDSPAYTDRVTAGRGGLLVAVDAYWGSVDGGALWENGEWLELCNAPELLTGEAVNALRQRAISGTDRQKYVAFCLLGELVTPGDVAIADLCATAAHHESHPGVAMAAKFAAVRHGRGPSDFDSARVFQDDLTHMAFVQLPPASAFRRGSDGSDSYRYDDEDRPDSGVPIDAIFMASTEVTQEVFSAFVAAKAADDALRNLRRRITEGIAAQIPEARRDTRAVGNITMNEAQQYCKWLNDLGAKAVPPRKYRLPTENEWEYAARAGSSGRFCFGNDSSYARFFANCDGASSFHITAERMPNWYGLFDMHGGLWEWTSSRYPPELAATHGVENQELFVYRGGAYYSPAVRCRAAQRNYGVSDAALDYIGIRLVMEFTKP